MQNYVEVDRAANEHRVLDINTYRVNIEKAEGPYGFWQISIDKGRLPEMLRGVYTSPSQAEDAAKNYFLNKPVKTDDQ